MLDKNSPERIKMIVQILKTVLKKGQSLVAKTFSSPLTPDSY